MELVSEVDMTEIDVMNAFKEKGIEVTIFQSPLKTMEKVVIDTSEHDKQIRADAIEECIQAIEDSKSLFDNSTHWTISEKDKLQNRLRRLKEQK